MVCEEGVQDFKVLAVLVLILVLMEYGLRAQVTEEKVTDTLS